MSELSYPVERMTNAAAQLRTLLDAGWEQHTQILNRTLLDPAQSLPGPVVGPFTDHLTAWQHQMRACYDALYDLATVLESAAREGETANTEARTSLTPE